MKKGHGRLLIRSLTSLNLRHGLPSWSSRAVVLEGTTTGKSLRVRDFGASPDFGGAVGALATFIMVPTGERGPHRYVVRFLNVQHRAYLCCPEASYSRGFPCVLVCNGANPLSRDCLFRLCVGARDIDVAIESEFANAPIDFRPKGRIVRHVESGAYIGFAPNGHAQLQPMTDVRATQQPETFVARCQPLRDVMYMSLSIYTGHRVSPEPP